MVPHFPDLYIDFFLDPYFSLPYDTSYRFFGHQFNVVDDDDDDLRFFFFDIIVLILTIFFYFKYEQTFFLRITFLFNDLEIKTFEFIH